MKPYTDKLFRQSIIIFGLFLYLIDDLDETELGNSMHFVDICLPFLYYCMELKFTTIFNNEYTC